MRTESVVISYFSRFLSDNRSLQRVFRYLTLSLTNQLVPYLEYAEIEIQKYFTSRIGIRSQGSGLIDGLRTVCRDFE
jgi:hypothetical protein